MQRVYTKDIPVPGKAGILFAKKGDVRDYPHQTWVEIGKSLFPKAKDVMAKLNEITQPISAIGNLIPDKR